MNLTFNCDKFFANLKPYESYLKVSFLLKLLKKNCLDLISSMAKFWLWFIYFSECKILVKLSWNKEKYFLFW